MFSVTCSSSCLPLLASPCLSTHNTAQELTKSYVVAPDLLEEKAPALTSVDGTKIDWKHKKNLCMTETKKKQKAKSGRKAGQVSGRRVMLASWGGMSWG